VTITLLVGWQEELLAHENLSHLFSDIFIRNR